MVTTKSQYPYLKRIFLHNRHANVPDLKVQYKNAYGVSLSKRIVRRRLVQCGLLAYRRHSWAKQHVS